MKLSNRKMVLESLEDRLAPAITAGVSNGLLSVRGFSSTGVILLATTTNPGEITVSDGGTSFTATGVNSINVALSGAPLAQNVFLDLSAAGSAINGNVTIDAGTAPGNTITLQDNPDADFDIAGSVSLSRAQVTAVASVDVLGNLTVNNSQYSLTTNIAQYILSDTQVIGSLTVTGGLYADNVSLTDVDVGGSARISLGGSTQTLPNTLTLDLDSTVAGTFAYSGGAGSNTVTLAGTLLADATISAGNGQNTVDFSSTGLVGRNLAITLGVGLGTGNQVGGTAFAGTVNGNLTISTGGGTSVVNLGATVNGSLASISMARGFNTLNLVPGLTISSGRMQVVMVRGGINTFNGNGVPISWPFSLYL
jgi:hypothetical protein